MYQTVSNTTDFIRISIMGSSWSVKGVNNTPHMPLSGALLLNAHTCTLST